MSTRTPSTRKPASSTGKSGKTTRAGRKRSSARSAKAPSAAAKTATGAAVAGTASGTASQPENPTVNVPPKPALATAAATPAAKTPEPMVVSEVTPVVTGVELRKKALIEAVTERSGVKRRDAKAALEAALELLGEAIAEGRPINLPGFGKLKVTRTKQLANGQVFTTRIRQPIVTEESGDESGAKSAKTVAKDPLAEAAE